MKSFNILIVLLANLFLFSCSNKTQNIDKYTDELSKALKFEFQDSYGKEILKCAEPGQNLKLYASLPVLSPNSELLKEFTREEIKNYLIKKVKNRELNTKILVSNSITKELINQIILVDTLGNYVVNDYCGECGNFVFMFNFTMPNHPVDFQIENKFKSDFENDFKTTTSNIVNFPLCLPKYEVDCNFCSLDNILLFKTDKSNLKSGESTIIKWEVNSTCEVYLKYLKDNKYIEERVPKTSELLVTMPNSGDNILNYEIILKCNGIFKGKKDLTIYREGIPLEFMSGDNGIFIVHGPKPGKFQFGCNNTEEMTDVLIYEFEIDINDKNVNLNKDYFKYGELLFEASKFNINEISNKKGENYQEYKKVIDNLWNFASQANSVFVLIQGFADANVPQNKVLRTYNQFDEVEKNIIKNDSLWVFYETVNNVYKFSETPILFEEKVVKNKYLPDLRSQYLRNFLIDNTLFSKNSKNSKSIPVGIIKGKEVDGNVSDRTVRLYVITTKKSICLDKLDKYFK